jgi:hypothetical protein
MMPLAQLLAGAMVASAVVRWGATVFRAGPASLARALPMARLRWTQYSSLRWTGWRPALAVLGALLLAQLALDAYADGGAGAARVLAWATVALVATLATYICPPSVLFLGSSEPGTYSSFRYLGDGHPWLAVAALKESDMRATEFQDYRRSMTSRLIPRRVRRALAALAPPPLSSLRSSDEVWEDVVTRALRLSQRVVLDLRSGAPFIRGEFVEVLRTGALARTVAVVRNDASSCIDALISDKPEIMAAMAKVLPSQALRDALYDGWTPLHQAPRASADVALTDVAEDLAVRLEARRLTLTSLLERLVAGNGADRALDADILATLDPDWNGGTAPSVTSSLDDAVACLRRVRSNAQYSLHITGDAGGYGAELGTEDILGSFRTMISARVDHGSCARALMDALVQTELGTGIGTGELVHVLIPFRVPPLDLADEDRTHLEALLDRVRRNAPDPDLDAALVHSIGQDLLRGVSFSPSTSVSDALALVHRGSSKWRAAVYVDPTVVDGGTATAEVFTAFGAGYLITHSTDRSGAGDALTPARAVMSAWLKGRLGQWDFYGQAGGSMEWCLGTPGERTYLSEGDRITLGISARYLQLSRRA